MKYFTFQVQSSHHRPLHIRRGTELAKLQPFKYNHLVLSLPKLPPAWEAHETDQANVLGATQRLTDSDNPDSVTYTVPTSNSYESLQGLEEDVSMNNETEQQERYVSVVSKHNRTPTPKPRGKQSKEQVRTRPVQANNLSSHSESEISALPRFEIPGTDAYEVSRQEIESKKLLALEEDYRKQPRAEFLEQFETSHLTTSVKEQVHDLLYKYRRVFVHPTNSYVRKVNYPEMDLMISKDMPAFINVKNYSATQDKRVFLHNTILKMEEDGILVRHDSPSVVLPCFAVKKPTSTPQNPEYRFLVDCRRVNEHIVVPENAPNTNAPEILGRLQQAGGSVYTVADNSQSYFRISHKAKKFVSIWESDRHCQDRPLCLQHCHRV